MGWGLSAVKLFPELTCLHAGLWLAGNLPAGVHKLLLVLLFVLVAEGKAYPLGCLLFLLWSLFLSWVLQTLEGCRLRTCAYSRQLVEAGLSAACEAAVGLRGGRDPRAKHTWPNRCLAREAVAVIVFAHGRTGIEGGSLYCDITSP